MVSPEFSETPPSNAEKLEPTIPIVEMQRGQFRRLEPGLTLYELPDPLLTYVELMSELKTVLGIEFGISERGISFSEVFYRVRTDRSLSDFDRAVVAGKDFISAMEKHHRQRAYEAGCHLVDDFDELLIVNSRNKRKKANGFESLGELISGNPIKGLSIKFID